MTDYRSTTINTKDLEGAESHPDLASIPDELKDREKYEEIEKKVLKIMRSDHKHRKVKTFVDCKRCSAKREKRREYIMSQGFESYRQYLLWKKVMNIIINGEEETTKNR